MPQSQSGIVLDHRRFAVYLEAMMQGDLAAFRQGVPLWMQQLESPAAL